MPKKSCYEGNCNCGTPSLGKQTKPPPGCSRCRGKGEIIYFDHILMMKRILKCSACNGLGYYK